MGQIRRTTGLLFLAIAPLGLMAQVAPDKTPENKDKKDETLQLETMTVAGSLQGQAKAIAATKDAPNLINVISSDNMGTFPDLNAAEALRRLPGVSLVQSGGEGRFVSIRGARPQYNATLTNGFTLPSGDSEIRRNDLVTVSNALIDTIVLTKTSTADMPGDGIGGSTNILMRNPLDLKGTQGGISAFYGRNGNGGKRQDREDINFGTFIDKDHKYAIEVAANHRLTDFFFTEYTVNQPNTFTGSAGAPVLLFPQFRYQLTEKSQENKGVDLSFAAKVGDNTRLVLRGFKSDSYQDQFVHRYTFSAFTPVLNGSGTAADLTDSGGLVTTRLNRLWRSRTWWLTIGGWQLTGTTDLGHDLKLDYGFQSARSLERYTNDFYISGTNTNTVDPVIVQIRSDSIKLFGTTPNAVAVLTDPSRQRISSNVDAPLRKDWEGEKTPYVNVTKDFDLGDGGSIQWKSGLYFRIKSKENPNLTYIRSALATSTLTFANLGSDGNFDNFDDKGINLGPKPNPVIGRQIVTTNSASFGPLTYSSAPGDPSQFFAKENIYAGYTMGTYTKGNWTLIAGVRYERTTEDYARETALISGIYKHFKGDYDNVLPSVHVKYKLAKDLFLRASFSQTVARPDATNIYGVYTQDDVNLTINQPNPGLKALQSQNYDASLDWYSGPLGQFMVGAFQKDITNFPLTITDTVSLNGSNYTRTSVQAGADGSITGYEASFRRNLNFLPSILSGLGVDLNYAKIDSQLNYAARPDSPNLPDQPNYVMNLSLYYAYKGIFARIASSTEGPLIRSTAATRDFDEIRDTYRTWDFSASYEFGHTHSYQVFFEWRNITNRPDTSHYRTSHMLTTRTDSGSNIGAGLRLRY